MDVNYKKGYVTFADILGWKGIWQSKKNGEAVENLLAIRNEMNKGINTFHKKYFIHLIQNELSSYLSDEQRKKALNIVRMDKRTYGVNEIIRQIYSMEDDREKSQELQNKYEEFSVNISIDLISDTFVITSSSDNKEYELLLHCLISQRLIIACLKYGFLIRGATSYGKFYKQELVFVGPAIDDSASWHEMGEEIGIFFTPKALLTINKDINIDIDEISFNSITMKTKPMLKIQSFDTYILDWTSGENDFHEIISRYDTILPAIHKKVLFSRSRLEEFKKLERIDGYYILNVPRTLKDKKTIMWWKKGNIGYTDDLSEARIFSKKEVNDKLANIHSAKKFLALPIYIVLKMNQSVVPFTERFISLTEENKHKIIGNKELRLSDDEIQLLL